MRSIKLLPFLLLFFDGLRAQPPAGFVHFELATGLNPTDLAVAPDGRVFIAEKNGLVRIVQNGVLLPDPFVILSVEQYNEQGLGHLALDPAFPTKPYVYVYYTVADGGGLSHNRLSRLIADGNFALPGSELVLYECDPTPATVHNGGAIVFGKDGKIYLSTGDKGRSDDVQSLKSDLGKVLRINDNGTIPSDNPFFSTASGKYRAIYALGLRNPFSMAVQPETGRIFACDVGGVVIEEVNEILAGKNYGWPLIEGPRTNQNPPANYQDPLHNYPHNSGRCSIVGAAFYPQNQGGFPASYWGKFYFADYCTGIISLLNPATGASVFDFLKKINRPVGIAITPAGEFFYLARAGIGDGSNFDNTASDNGSLWKVVFTGNEKPFVYTQPQGALLVEGEDFQLQTQATGREPLHFQWQKNGSDIPGADSNLLIIKAVTLADSGSVFRCVVRNALGTDSSKTALLRVSANQRPLPEIEKPTADFLYEAGSTLAFEGGATDPEMGALPPSALSWKVDFHHDDHIHPVLTPTKNTASGSIFIPSVGEVDDNVWYRIYLTAKDDFGLARTVVRDVFPKKCEIRVRSNLPEIEVDADGFRGETPFVFKSVVGLERSLTVPQIIDLQDSILVFKNWDDGFSKPYREFETPDTAALEFTALYDVWLKNSGIGLLGEYFLDALPPSDFSEKLLRSRLDTLVNFEWQDGSPEPGFVPSDGFVARWTGQVVAYEDGVVNFYTISDDGARLWVADSLLIDHLHPQGQTEYAAPIFLKGGKRYPIRLEFLEAGGWATMKLRWSMPRLPKEIIPTRQLFPPQHLIPNKLRGIVWLDADANGQFDGLDFLIKNAAVLLLDDASGATLAATTTDSTGVYSLASLPSGRFRLYVLPPLEAGSVRPGFGLLPSSQSEVFSLAGEEALERDFSFFPEKNGVASGSRAWDVQPNPTVGVLVFRKKKDAFEEKFKVRVLSATGKICLEKTLPEQVWEMELDLSRLAAGVYFVQAGGAVVRVLRL